MCIYCFLDFIKKYTLDYNVNKLKDEKNSEDGECLSSNYSRIELGAGGCPA